MFRLMLFVGAFTAVFATMGTAQIGLLVAASETTNAADSPFVRGAQMALDA